MSAPKFEPGTRVVGYDEHAPEGFHGEVISVGLSGELFEVQDAEGHTCAFWDKELRLEVATPTVDDLRARLRELGARYVRVEHDLSDGQACAAAGSALVGQDIVTDWHSTERTALEALVARLDGRTT